MPKNPKNKRSVSVTPELHERMKVYSEQHGIPIRELVDRAVLPVLPSGDAIHEAN